MVKRDTVSIDVLVEDWISVSEEENPIAFKAWIEWRRYALNCHFVPKLFTVPSLFPPGTQQAANDYAGAVTSIRKSIGWNSDRAKLPRDIQPWHALVQ